MARTGSGKRVGTLTVAGVLAGTVLVACGDGDSADDAGNAGSASASESAGAREQGTQAVRSAYDKTAEEDTARMTMRVVTSAQGQSVTVDGEGTIDLSEGDSVMTVTAQGQEIEQRVVDQVLYQKMPEQQGSGGKPWIKIDLEKAAAQQGGGGQTVSNPADSAAFAKAISDKDVAEKGTEKVGGVDTTRYRVNVDVNELPNGAELSRQVGGTLPMDVWLDDEGRIRRQQMDMTVKVPAASSEQSAAGSSASPQEAKVRTVVEFTDFGTEVEAEAPPAGEVTDMTGKALEQGQGRTQQRS
ncbi:putative lipoprotein [Streptomyces ruber]|uniref:Lipoprotein n=2 Tax=Streptomyces TaxID=1883 RepID=A0A918BKJ5_9ACTN|nr:hypothetical protein [Streptomyces ruber]GGQ76187.1 putative lipoprotein [Streptomyces ruber]